MINSEIKSFAKAFSNALEGSLLILDSNLKVICANRNFYEYFKLEEQDAEGKLIYELREDEWEIPELRELLKRVSIENDSSYHGEISVIHKKEGLRFFSVHVGKICWDKEKDPLIKISFQDSTSVLNSTERDQFYLKNLNNIMKYAPAVLCTLKGPDHVYEIANQRYMELLGFRDLIGKSVKDALPEIVSQGIIALLDEVYSTGKPYIGKEEELKLDLGGGKWSTSYFDFIYQPTLNSRGNVDGIFAFAIDVTEQVLARREIEQHKNELTSILDTVPSMIWMNNKKGEITFLNKSWYKFTGVKKENLQNLGWLEFIHAEDRDLLKQTFLRANSEEKPYILTYRMLVTNGDYRWVMATGQPKYDKQGNFDGLIGSVTDVHEEKQKEELIREKEHFTRSIVEEATVATAVYTGEEMIIELANEAMIKVWGKDRTYVGKTFKEALPELDGHHFYDLLKEVYKTGETYWGKNERVELLVNNKLQKGYFDFTYKPLRDEKGQIFGVLNMAVDVTEMVEKKNLLRESEKHYRQLANFLPDKVTNTNAHGEFVYFNQHWLDFTGLSSKELQIKCWPCFIHPDEREDFDQKWQKSLDTGSDFEKEIRLRDQWGEYKWHLSRAEPVRDEAGDIKMWISTNTEIQRLKEEEKRKEDFLKMVSHELKTPVTSIKGYVQLLLIMLTKGKDLLPENIPLKPSLERIDHQIVRLTRLISEMLDLSRLEENKLELQKEVFCLNDLVHQTVQDINYTNTQHKIKIYDEYKCMINADRDRVGQVLINIVTNAIKYSPDSQDVEIYIQKGKNGMVAISVRDKGIGIDPKDYQNIFKRFYRAAGESEETYSGFGIGLYLANEILERHNGSISVKSNKGKGSDFSFLLPVALE